MKEKLKSICKIVGTGVVTLGAMAVECAAGVELMGKICEGCDEDNPANFGQVVGVAATYIGMMGAETATMLGGVYLIEQEIEENW